MKRSNNFRRVVMVLSLLAMAVVAWGCGQSPTEPSSPVNDQVQTQGSETPVFAN